MDFYKPAVPGPSQEGPVWSKIQPDFLFSLNPGTYLLRKDRWNESKYYATLTAIYDGFSGRIKFAFNEREEVPYEVLYNYVVDETDGRDMDALNRKVYMASFKFHCDKYNNQLDSWPLSSQGGLVRLHYETALSVTLAALNQELLQVFDSFSVVSPYQI